MARSRSLFRRHRSIDVGEAGLSPVAGVAAESVEPDRFRQIMLPHMDAAYGYARYLVRDPVAAEDIVQEAFLRALRGFHTYRGDGPRAWLLAIVRHCFIDRAGAERHDAAAAMAAEAEIRDHDTPEAILMRRHEGDMVRATIEDLPEPFREAIVLRELEELSYKEIAALTAAPIGTVMSRLARAREMLGALLLPVLGSERKVGS